MINPTNSNYPLESKQISSSAPAVQGISLPTPSIGNPEKEESSHDIREVLTNEAIIKGEQIIKDNGIAYKHISPKLFAHIHSDNFAEDSGLEGFNSQKSLEACYVYILTGNVNIPRSDDLCNNYDKMIEWSKKIQENKIDAVTEELFNAIRNLNPGQSIEIPGGWIEKEENEYGGHVLLYSIEKTENDTIQFSIFNTGNGIKYHYNEGMRGKLKIGSKLRLIQDPADPEKLKEGLRALLEMNSPQVINEKDKLKNPDYLYQTLLPAMNLVKAPYDKVKDADDPMTAQRSGTCSWRVQMAYLRDWIFRYSESKEEALKTYKAVKRDIRLRSLIDFYEVNKNNLEDHQVVVQIEKTLPRMYRSLRKAETREGISPEERDKTIGVLSAIRKALDLNYQKSQINLPDISYEAPNFGKKISLNLQPPRQKPHYFLNDSYTPYAPQTIPYQSFKNEKDIIIALNALDEMRDHYYNTSHNVIEQILSLKKLDNFLQSLEDYALKGAKVSNVCFDSLDKVLLDKTFLETRIFPHQMGRLLNILNKLTETLREQHSLPAIIVAPEIEKRRRLIDKNSHEPVITVRNPKDAFLYRAFLLKATQGICPGTYDFEFDKLDPSKEGLNWIKTILGNQLDPDANFNELIDHLPLWAKTLFKLSTYIIKKGCIPPSSESKYNNEYYKKYISVGKPEESAYLTEDKLDDKNKDFAALFTHFEALGENLLALANKQLATIEDSCTSYRPIGYPLDLSTFGKLLLIPGVLEDLFETQPHYMELYAQFFQKAIAHFTQLGQWNKVITLAVIGHDVLRRIPTDSPISKNLKDFSAHKILFELMQKHSNLRKEIIPAYAFLEIPEDFSTERLKEHFLLLFQLEHDERRSMQNPHNLANHVHLTNLLFKLVQEDPNTLVNVVKNAIFKAYGMVISFPDNSLIKCDLEQAEEVSILITWKDNVLLCSCISGNIIFNDEWLNNTSDNIENIEFKSLEHRINLLRTYVENNDYHYEFKRADGGINRYRQKPELGSPFEFQFKNQWYTQLTDGKLYSLLQGIVIFPEGKQKIDSYSQDELIFINYDSSGELNGPPNVIISPKFLLNPHVEPRAALWITSSDTPHEHIIAKIESLTHPGMSCFIPNPELTDEDLGTPILSILENGPDGKGKKILDYPKAALSFDVVEENGREIAYCKEHPHYYLIRKNTRYGNKPSTSLILEWKDGAQIVFRKTTEGLKKIFLSPNGTVQAKTFREHLEALVYYLSLESVPDIEEKARRSLSHCIPTRKMSEEEVSLMQEIISRKTFFFKSSPIVTPEVRAIRLKLAVRLMDHYLYFAPDEKANTTESDFFDRYIDKSRTLTPLLKTYLDSPGVSPALQLTPHELQRLGASSFKISLFLSTQRHAIQFLQNTTASSNPSNTQPWKPFKENNDIDWWLSQPSLNSIQNLSKAWAALVDVAKGNDTALKNKILFRMRVAANPKDALEELWLKNTLTSLLTSKEPINPNLNPTDFKALAKFYQKEPSEKKLVPYDHTDRKQIENLPELQLVKTIEAVLNDKKDLHDPIISLKTSPPTIPTELWNTYISEQEGKKSTQSFSLKPPVDADPSVHHHFERINQDLADYRSTPPTVLHKVEDRFGLEKELKAIVQKDHEAIQKIEKEILNIAGKYPADREARIRRQIDEQSGAHPFPTIPKLIKIYLQADEALFKKMNPELNDHEVKTLVEKLSDYLDSRSLLNRRQRVLNVLHDSSHETLSEALNAKRSYDTLPKSRLCAIQVFESLSGLTLRKKQLDMLIEILDGKIDSEQREFVKQLIMGGGKSEVILPLLATLLADGNKLAMLCIPRSLLDSQREELRHTCISLFGREIVPFEFDRSSDSRLRALQDIYNSLITAINNRDFIVTSPESIEALGHLQTEWILARGEGPELEMMTKILALFKDPERGVAILDEAHALLNARRELNFTVGERKGLEPNQLHLIRELYEMIATDEVIKNHISIFEEKSSSQAKSQGEKIKARLVDLAIERYFPKYEKKDKQALKLYISRDPTLKETPDFIRSMKPEKRTQVALLREEIGRSVVAALSKVALQEYAYGLQGYAIPAHHSQVQIGTEFGFPLETVNHTYQLILTTPVPPGILGNAINSLVETLETHIANKVDVTQLKDWDLFKTLFPNIPLFGPWREHLSEASDILRKKPIIALYFAEKYILPSLTYFDAKISSNSLRFVNQIGKVFGFTGTPANDDSYPDRLGVGKAVLDKGTDGLTIDLLLAMKPKIIEIALSSDQAMLPDEQEVEKRMQPLQIAPGGPVRAIIDTAAYFKGLPTQKVAKSIARHLGIDSLGLNYYDDDKKITASETNPDKRVTFYDDAHTIGAHFDQAPHAEAIVIIGDNIELNHLLQAVWRMRQIHKDQKVSFAITKPVMDLIKKRQSVKAEELITIEHILSFAATNQAERVALDTYRATSLKFSAAVHKQVTEALYRNIQDSINIAYPFVEMEGVFKESTAFDPWSQFGEVLDSGKTIKLLENLRDEWIKKIESNLSIDEPLKQNIIQALKKVEIPRAEKMPQNSELPLTNMGSEVVNKVQAQSSQKAHTQTETLLQMETLNEQQYGIGKLKKVKHWDIQALDALTQGVIPQNLLIYPVNEFCSFFKALNTPVKVFVSDNYAKGGLRDGTTRNTIGTIDQRPIRHMLIARAKDSYRMVIVNEDDMVDLKKLMMENPHAQRWIYQLWVNSCDLTADRASAAEAMTEVAMQKAMVAVKLLDGQVHYTPSEVPIVRSIISNIGWHNFLNEFSLLCRYRDTRTQFDGSVLDQLLREMKPEM